jgi:hypothetical protein
MNTWLTWAAGVLALIGTTWGGFVIVDERYAKAGEVQQQVDSLKSLYMRSELRDVQREKFQIEVTKQQRKLTPLEGQRLEQLRQEEKGIQDHMQRLEKLTPP